MGKVIGYIATAILILFGVLMIIGATDETGDPIWIPIGGFLIVLGLGMIWLIGRKAKSDSTELIQKIELSGDVNLEALSCQSCGGALSPDNIKMVAGAPVVTCPYCDSTYQLSEEPKW
ncbi:MAG: hypothetical protein ABUK15_10405 [Anaerolineales bacterium]